MRKGEAWCTDSEITSSDSDSVGVSDCDGNDTELPLSPVKRRCSTRSERSTTGFAFR